MQYVFGLTTQVKMSMSVCRWGHFAKTVNFMSSELHQETILFPVSKYHFFASMSGPWLSLPFSSISLNRVTEDYLVRTIWLCCIDPSWVKCWEAQLSQSLYLRSVTLLHSSVSLWTDFKRKNQMSRRWFSESWLNKSYGTTCWWVCVYKCACMWQCMCSAWTWLTMPYSSRGEAVAN